MDRILCFCIESGSSFVDPSFPPLPKSLYYNIADANTWKCMIPTCGHTNTLPANMPIMYPGSLLDPGIDCRPYPTPKSMYGWGM